MNQEFKLRLITAFTVLQDNLIMSIDNSKYRNKLQQRFKALKGNYTMFLKELFGKADKGQLDNYDEWANQIMDIIEISNVVGLERSIAILNAYNNGEIKEESN